MQGLCWGTGERFRGQGTTSKPGGSGGCSYALAAYGSVQASATMLQCVICIGRSCTCDSDACHVTTQPSLHRSCELRTCHILTLFSLHGSCKIGQAVQRRQQDRSGGACQQVVHVHRRCTREICSLVRLAAARRRWARVHVLQAGGRGCKLYLPVCFMWLIGHGALVGVDTGDRLHVAGSIWLCSSWRVRSCTRLCCAPGWRCCRPCGAGSGCPGARGRSCGRSGRHTRRRRSTQRR